MECLWTRNITIIYILFIVIQKSERQKKTNQMLEHRKNRLKNIFLILLFLSIGVGFILYSLNSKIDLYLSPSEIDFQNLPTTRIKLGGVVKKNSIRYEQTLVNFTLTDFSGEIDVIFEGIPPDLFKENSGAVVLGHFSLNKLFVAEELFAKHDENYMPPNKNISSIYDS